MDLVQQALPKILLVDDSKAILSKLSHELKALSFDVTTAVGPKIALELLATGNFDCIVSDYEMPEITGPEFAAMVKNDENLRLIPFIILTSRDESEYLLNAISSGADDFLTKNLPIEVVAKKIQAMLRLANLRKEATELRWLEGIRQVIVTYNHEFNNPLSIAIGFCELIRKDLPPEKIENFNKLAKQLDRLTELVKKLSQATKPVEGTYLGKTKMIKIA